MSLVKFFTANSHAYYRILFISRTHLSNLFTSIHFGSVQWRLMTVIRWGTATSKKDVMQHHVFHDGLQCYD